MRGLLHILKIFLAYLVLSAGCSLMLEIIIQYTQLKNDVLFLRVKQAYLHDRTWKTAFYIHVFSAVIALLAGFTQFSNSFFILHRKLHRLIGKIYAWDILVINFPAGMVLAISANGMLFGRIAFVTLDVLWALFTYLAVKSALNKDFAAHRDFMTRSYALTFSAVTLRSWHMILQHFAGINPLELYVMDAWLGFVPNLLVAEIIIRHRKKRKISG